MSDELCPPIDPKATYAEVYGPAMRIFTQPMADIYMNHMVDHAMQWWAARNAPVSRVEAGQQVRRSLLLYALHFDALTRSRVEHLFGANHPGIRTYADRGHPTPWEAALIGIEHAQFMRSTGGVS